MLVENLHLHFFGPSPPQSLSKLQSLLRQTELGFKLDHSRDLTYFVPNDAAIESSGFDELGNYLEYEDALRVLNNHIIPQTIKIGDLPEGTHEFETLADSTLLIRVSEQKSSPPSVTPSKNVTVLVKNGDAAGSIDVDSLIDSSNGVLYIVSCLLVPEALQSVVEEAKEKRISGSSSNYSSSNTSYQTFSVPEHVKETNRAHWSQKDGTIQSTIPVVQVEEFPTPEVFWKSNALISEAANPGIGVINGNDSGTKRIEGVLVPATFLRRASVE